MKKLRFKFDTFRVTTKLATRAPSRPIVATTGAGSIHLSKLLNLVKVVYVTQMYLLPARLQQED